MQHHIPYIIRLFTTNHTKVLIVTYSICKLLMIGNLFWVNCCKIELAVCQLNNAWFPYIIIHLIISITFMHDYIACGCISITNRNIWFLVLEKIENSKWLFSAFSRQRKLKMMKMSLWIKHVFQIRYNNLSRFSVCLPWLHSGEL